MTFEHYARPPVEGRFVDFDGERYYKISNVDQMEPFFISVVSASDHWLFISSTGSLSAGRIRPENALFPYKSVDHIHESAENTGSKTIIKVALEQGVAMWEPFNRHHDGLYQVERHLYKNAVGDKIVFEESNHTLKLKFQYSWSTSEELGFVRRSQIEDLSGSAREVELIDGLQNILPSGAPLPALQTRSALVDAYKWNELLEGSSLALFTMYAKLSDRAEPAESLLATTVFSVDNDPGQRLLCSKQVNAFRQGEEITSETLTKGVRGSYLIHKSIRLEANQSKTWFIIADIDKNHSDVVAISNHLSLPFNMTQQIEQSIAANQQELIGLMSGADAWQITAEEETSVHHYANVLFNNMRGGVFENNYTLDKRDVLTTLRKANLIVFERHASLLMDLPEKFSHSDLVNLAKQSGDAQLTRLSYEYLPLTFGRRHGDPSRPWNHYEIKLKDDNGERLLSYQGNWRDIFQNWEAIALSYPEFIQSFLAKFVNASTMDGYNPYRITKDGIDWELLEPDDPWSNIGYWGDHQIIYLLKFLELADKYQHEDLLKLMQSEVFSYANVPYELCDVDSLFSNPKDTVAFNEELQHSIERRVETIGSDGRLVLDSGNDVYMVNLTEKVLVPLLAKLSNLVLDGGIWLNTQRPEWNDANNAIVGNGLSMVTLYYMRRYVAFLQRLLAKMPTSLNMSKEVFEWLLSTTRILSEAAKEIRQETVTRQTRKAILTQLEKAADEFRQRVYRVNGFSGKTMVETSAVQQLLEVSLTVLDASITSNLREDGLFNAYNILTYSAESLQVEELYPMLEGQVAVLSAGVLTPAQAVKLLENLFASEMYRKDQSSFMLYPDRELASFMNKNCLSDSQIDKAPVLRKMISDGDQRIVNADEQGKFHFHASLENNGYLRDQIQKLRNEYSYVMDDEWHAVEALYEEVFNHKAFTGRSGTMFGYEGLGCIYWHMVSKLLLAVQENYLLARGLDADSEDTKKLAEYYYRVRAGIGFNKTPENYGAFPTDPYSHTPKHAGAQQPGMTGQVKEEIITRFVELGIIVKRGEIHIEPQLLNRTEFLNESTSFSCQNVAGNTQSYVIDKDQLAFTLCQVPFVYKTVESDLEAGLVVTKTNGKQLVVEQLVLSKELSNQIFTRSGDIEKVVVSIPTSLLRS